MLFDEKSQILNRHRRYSNDDSSDGNGEGTITAHCQASSIPSCEDAFPSTRIIIVLPYSMRQRYVLQDYA